MTEATIKLSVGGKTEHVVAEGDGPVNALDTALRKALASAYPRLAEMHLADYKVRVINSAEGTAARVRVVIESRDANDVWTTVGVSENVIEASWLALVDSVEYKLYKDAGGLGAASSLATGLRCPALESCSLTRESFNAQRTDDGRTAQAIRSESGPIPLVPVLGGVGLFQRRPQPGQKAAHDHDAAAERHRALHMGHALNDSLQDLLTRWRRMQGYEALWMPGTDHAGIATQAVVERRMLEEEGLTRHEVGREALVNRIWKWKDAYEERILGQLKQLGASCDWRRTRFTLDDICTFAVRRTFFKFFADGLIYRGKRLVNWDTYLQTAVADDEVFHEDVDGHFWTFTYPVVGSEEPIAFATTRPETMLGDTAICVNPSDDRYRHLIGKKVRIPLNGREIPIIGDAMLAKMDMGTGAVKVTPAHDPNDYACGLRHKLPMINILNPDGTLNEQAGEYAGMDRYKARDLIVEKMQALGHLVSVEERKIPLAHSDRSKTPDRAAPLRPVVRADGGPGPAGDRRRRRSPRAVLPGRYAKTYLDWLGEKRDWCISRQLWWGHRIPIWYCDDLHRGRVEESLRRAQRRLLAAR